MLVTFRTKAHADITMFGDVAVELLKLAGMSGTVPTAILARDIPDVLAALETGLSQRRALPETPEAASRDDAGVDAGGGPRGSSSRSARGSSRDDPDAQPAVPLGHRALPLIELLRAANRASADVIVATNR